LTQNAIEPRVGLVVTTIFAPTPAMFQLVEGCQKRGYSFHVMGDVKSPSDFSLPGASYMDIPAQRATGFKLAEILPERHYARKNIGYLSALRGGADVLIETDDDNYPRDSFFEIRPRHIRVRHSVGAGWTNVYGWFTDVHSWPRGFPLDAVLAPRADYDALPELTVDCPVQQGLADENPDVDAIYRLTLPLPFNFRPDRRVALGRFSWCPFNSQNTTWYRDAVPMVYMPSLCSIRMTDIWRGFIAQRIAWENGWSVLFHEASVWQERNEHDLMRDFRDELPGYLNNRRIIEELERLTLRPGVKENGENLLRCYEALIRMELVGAGELKLIEAWNQDLRQLGVL
jgi:hypothetical protein